MNFKNFTPHEINLVKPGIGYSHSQDMKTKVFTGIADAVVILKTIPSLCHPDDPDTLPLPRASFGKEHTTWHGNIPVDAYEAENGILDDMPDPEVDTLFIVSGITAAIAKLHGRTDCVSPNKLVRNAENGSEILGCLSLRRP